MTARYLIINSRTYKVFLFTEKGKHDQRGNKINVKSFPLIITNEWNKLLEKEKMTVRNNDYI